MTNKKNLAKGQKKEKKVKEMVKKKALTMGELLKEEGLESFGLKRGDSVKGKISAIKNKAIYIDIGGKTDAVVGGKEFEFVRDDVADLKVGDEIEVNVKIPENDKGEILVSIRGAASGYGWNYFEEKQKSEGEVAVFAKELNRGGAVVIAPFGFFGFIPGSQIGQKYEGDAARMLGKKVKVKILEVDKDKNRLVFSERLVSEPDKVGEESGIIDALKTEAEFEAEVVRVEPFGVFVKVAVNDVWLEGLIHISEISWEKVSDVMSMYKTKAKIKVKLINKDDGRLQFSIKRLTDDPWFGIEKKYVKDKEMEGEVVRLANFGALVRLEVGVEGLIHVSKLVGGVELNEGDKVQVYIESVDVERRKISLGLVVTDKSKVIYK